MRLADRWREIERELPEDWDDARCCCGFATRPEAERAASPLTPLMPGRSGNEIRFHAARRGAGAAPDAVRRVLRRLDREGVRGELELVSSGAPEPGVLAIEQPRLAEAWDAALATAAARLERPLRRARADLERPARAGRAAALAREPGPLRRQARLPLPRGPALRLRRLARDDAALPGAHRRRGDQGAAADPARALGHRSRSRRRGRSGTSRARRSRCARPDLLVRAGAGPQGGDRRRRGARQGSSRSSATRVADIFDGLDRRHRAARQAEVRARRARRLDRHRRGPPLDLEPTRPTGSTSTRRPTATSLAGLCTPPGAVTSPRMLRKLLWSAIYGLLAAAATMAARRAATQLYRLVTGETPPVKK